MPGRKVHGGKRNTEQRERDLELTARLYCQGWTQAAIAAHIGTIRPYTLDQRTISKDLEEVRRRWRDSAIRSFDELRERELAKLDNLEASAWEDFLLSRQGPDGPRPGDPRFLAQVERCIGKRCDLLGLEAPKRIQATIGTLERPYLDLTEAELAALAAGEVQN